MTLEQKQGHFNVKTDMVKLMNITFNHYQSNFAHESIRRTWTEYSKESKALSITKEYSGLVKQSHNITP